MTVPRPRVLHVITHLDMGGAENVAMALIEQTQSNVDSAVFAVLRMVDESAVGRDMAARLGRWGVPCSFGVAGRFKSGGVIVAARNLIRALSELRIDVVHLHCETAELTFAVACVLSGRARRVPLLRTVHNSELWIDWHAIGRWVTARLAHGEAVAVSRNAAAADRAIVTRRARAEPTIIHNGVAPPPRADVVRAAAPFRLLFAGRLVHQKGADLLPAILAAAHAATARRDVSVTIAGSGVMRDRVVHALEGALPGWDIRIIPPIERLAEQLRDYDAVLLPSRFEGFALLPLEVLVAGVPLVTTSAPGLDEVIPVDYPLLAAPEDVPALGACVARVIDDPHGMRAIAVQLGDDLARRFSQQAMAAAYLSRYRALAGRGEAA